MYRNYSNSYMKDNRILSGRYVSVDGEGDKAIERALRKLKKKVQNSNVFNDLKAKEFYEKPTTERKRKKNLAKRRWQRKLEEAKLPSKDF